MDTHHSNRLIPTGERAKAKFTKLVPLGEPLNPILLSAKPEQAAKGFSGKQEVGEQVLEYEVPPYPPDQELLVLDTEEKTWYFVFSLITPDRHMAYSISWIAFLLFIPLFVIYLKPYGLAALIAIPAVLIIIMICSAHIVKKYKKKSQ